MFRQIQKSTTDTIEVIVGPQAIFNGRLRCNNSIRIDGTVEGGQIETSANVILTESARVHCDITAKTVSIRGMYKGVVRADRVELLDGSQIYGTLYVNSFYMDEGVMLSADLNMQGTPAEEKLVLPKPGKLASIPLVNPLRSAS